MWIESTLDQTTNSADSFTVEWQAGVAFSSDGYLNDGEGPPTMTNADTAHNPRTTAQRGSGDCFQNTLGNVGCGVMPFAPLKEAPKVLP